MLSVILDISEITGRKIHFVTYLIAGLFCSVLAVLIAAP